MKIEIPCETPECKEAIAKYGEQYKMVYKDDKGNVSCQRCGGKKVGDKWEHKCQRCKKEVEPGKLEGLFVPHMCKECSTALYKAEQASGNVCLMCRTPRSFCCC